jgi:hypothetical protein
MLVVSLTGPSSSRKRQRFLILFSYRYADMSLAACPAMRVILGVLALGFAAGAPDLDTPRTPDSHGVLPPARQPDVREEQRGFPRVIAIVAIVRGRNP